MGQEDELKKVTGRELLSKYGSDEPPEHRGHPVKMVTFEEQLLVDAGWGGGGRWVCRNGSSAIGGHQSQRVRCPGTAAVRKPPLLPQEVE